MPTIEQVRDALRAVKDPELNLNVIDLGLVYDVDVREGGEVHVQMTLTSPGCPAGPEMLSEAQSVLQALEGVTKAEVELVWEPYWTPERMDPRVRSLLWG
jgi:metal-sulfur cluster biosynthetic enzyme